MKKFNNVEREIKTIAQMETFAREVMDTDMNHWNLNVVCAVMLVAQKDGKKDIVKKCLDRLMSDADTQDSIKWIMNRNYVRYGTDETRCIYDVYSYEECRKHIEKETFRIWSKLMNEEKLLPWFDKTYNQKKFVKTFLNLRLRDAFNTWAWKKAKEIYPDLTNKSMRLYVQVRKASNYEIRLATDSMAKIQNFCLENNINVSLKSIVNMKKGFGYEADEKTPLEKTVAWKKEHKKEIMFWKDTKANQIEEQEVDESLKKIKNRLGYTDEEMACLRNWIYTARYEGRANSAFTCMPKTFDARYRKKDSDTDVTICRRVRRDIIREFGTENRVFYTFSKNLNGRY